MININDEKCTGCGACLQICPQKCIKLSPDNDGFTYPEIDTDACISCGACDNVCPIEKPLSENKDLVAYAVVSKNKKYLSQATSGGAFGEIAKFVLGKGGVVYGCSYSNDCSVKHIRVSDDSELYKLYGSKYVQSDTADTFSETKQDLENGLIVLYSGTPCQIAGLKGFLKKNYDNLITADLICHGVPSLEYFKKFKNGLEESKGIKINTVDFRSKSTRNWSCHGTLSYTKNDNSYTKAFYSYQHYYYFYFLKSFIYRDCCYTCKYTNINRVADFTLGDLWGAEGLNLPFEIKNGCSLVLVNTSKANEIFSHLDFDCEKIDVSYAIKYNSQLREPSKRHDIREVLLKQFRENTYEEQQNFFRKTFKKNILISKIKVSVPLPIAQFLQKIRYTIKKRR